MFWKEKKCKKKNSPYRDNEKNDLNWCDKLRTLIMKRGRVQVLRYVWKFATDTIQNIQSNRINVHDACTFKKQHLNVLTQNR